MSKELPSWIKRLNEMLRETKKDTCACTGAEENSASNEDKSMRDDAYE